MAPIAVALVAIVMKLIIKRRRSKASPEFVLEESLDARPAPQIA